MVIPETDAPQSGREGPGQSETEPQFSGVDLRIEIKPVSPNLENPNRIAEIFPCK
jgi:hypothetical protein